MDCSCLIVEECKQEYVSNERRTPVHKPVLRQIDEVHKCGRCSTLIIMGPTPTGIAVSRIAGCLDLQRVDDVKQRVKRPARNEYAVSGIDAKTITIYKKNRATFYDCPTF